MLQDAQDIEWTVQAADGAVVLLLLAETSANFKLAAVAAVGCESDGRVPLQLWVTRSLMFPKHDRQGQPKSLPAQFLAYNGIRAVATAEIPDQFQRMACLPDSRSHCVPVVITLSAARFRLAQVTPVTLKKAVQRASDISASASLSVGAALAFAKQPGSIKFSR